METKTMRLCRKCDNPSEHQTLVVRAIRGHVWHAYDLFDPGTRENTRCGMELGEYGLAEPPLVFTRETALVVTGGKGGA